MTLAAEGRFRRFSHEQAIKLDLLRRAIANGYANFAWPHQDPDLAIVHDDPEFLSLFPQSSTS